MKIFITGAAGFIGGHLMEKLIKDGHEVRGKDNWFHASKNPIIEKVNYGDIRYYSQIEEYVKWSDVVFHLAAQIHVDRSIESPQETIDINVTGTLNILEAVRKYNKKMVFASSSEVYGTQKYSSFYCGCQDSEGIRFNNLGDIPEIHPLDAQSPYAASKVAGDRLCKSYFDTYGTQVSILRNFNTFGPYQADESYGGVIAIFTRCALKGEPIRIFGDGEQERDYMPVSEAIRGYEFCINEGLYGRPVNIGTGETVKIKEVAKRIKDITKSKSKIIYVKPRAGEVQRLCADISFAKSKGFKIKNEFNNKLNEYIKWYEKQR